MERKLAAILAADVVGYSRLIGLDEAGTLSWLRALRQEVVEPTLARHRGRIVKLMGDGLLAEFPSAVDAVAAAVDIQERAQARSTDLPQEQKVVLRVGVNLGDVVIEDGDLFGDGVNVAARLQEVAAPNGIAIADDVYRQLRGKLNVGFQDGGEKRLKNIAEPVHVWFWSAGDAPAGSTVGQARPTVPAKPSIAILPFANMSDEAGQEYFADGMTEDIITGLSRFRSLSVVARNSTFAYKGRAPDVGEVARDLGVRYVLEGSVRRSGGRIRITGQLIDAETGSHIWAERYDRDLDDIFQVQDEVTDAIVAAIAPEIDEKERDRSRRKPLENLDAWDLYQHGLASYHASTDEGLRSAVERFDGVIDVDPSFALAYAMAANARARYALHSIPEDREAVLRKASRQARRGVALDPKDATCLWTDGRVDSMLGHHDVAIGKIEKAIQINANDAMSHYFLGWALCRAGRAGEAVAHIDEAMRLSPHDVYSTAFFTYRAVALFDLARYDEALAWAERARLAPNPRTMTYAVYAASLSVLGRPDEARAAIGDLLAHAPAMTCAEYRRNPIASPEAMERMGRALHEAGLPE